MMPPPSGQQQLGVRDRPVRVAAVHDGLGEADDVDQIAQRGLGVAVGEGRPDAGMPGRGRGVLSVVGCRHGNSMPTDRRVGLGEMGPASRGDRTAAATAIPRRSTRPGVQPANSRHSARQVRLVGVSAVGGDIGQRRARSHRSSPGPLEPAHPGQILGAEADLGAQSGRSGGAGTSRHRAATSPIRHCPPDPTISRQARPSSAGIAGGGRSRSRRSSQPLTSSTAAAAVDRLGQPLAGPHREPRDEVVELEHLAGQLAGRHPEERPRGERMDGELDAALRSADPSRTRLAGAAPAGCAGRRPARRTRRTALGHAERDLDRQRPGEREHQRQVGARQPAMHAGHRRHPVAEHPRHRAAASRGDRGSTARLP